MACECPIITSTTGCSREVTADAALLTDTYDINDIAEKIELLLTQPELRNNLIKKGLNRVKSFSWGKCAAETINLFHSLDF